MKRTIGIILAMLAVSVTMAWAATEKVDTNTSAFPMHFKAGIYVGSASHNVVADTLNKVAAIKSCSKVDLNIPAAGANETAVVTTSCLGAALGEIIMVAPQQDDPCWDEGTLTVFVESANTVKLVFHADVTGCDPAATNDYVFTWFKRI